MSSDENTPSTPKKSRKYQSIVDSSDDEYTRRSLVSFSGARTSTPNQKRYIDTGDSESDHDERMANSNIQENSIDKSSIVDFMKSCMEKITNTEALVNSCVDGIRRVEKKVDDLLKDRASESRSKSNACAIEVPAQVQQSVRDGFADAERNRLTWSSKAKDGTPLKAYSDENRELSDSVAVFVKGQYANTENGVIKAGIERYFRSFKNKSRLADKGMLEDHKKKMVKYSRKQRKMQYRTKALSMKKSWPEEKVEKVKEALKTVYMSSEDDDSKDDTVFVVRPLSWRSEELKAYLDSLDKKHKEGLSSQGKKAFNKRSTGRMSARPAPVEVPATLQWILKDVRNNTAEGDADS